MVWVESCDKQGGQKAALNTRQPEPNDCSPATSLEEKTELYHKWVSKRHVDRKQMSVVKLRIKRFQVVGLVAGEEWPAVTPEIGTSMASLCCRLD